MLITESTFPLPVLKVVDLALTPFICGGLASAPARGRVVEAEFPRPPAPPSIPVNLLRMSSK